MIIPIVDQNDEIIGYKNREEITLQDCYRVSALWITNSQGQVLLARRAWDKKHDPGKWGPAVAGTVERGETYESNIIKEAMEELGIAGTSFVLGKKELKQNEWKYFCQEFEVSLDWPIDKFIVNRQEVAEIKRFDIEDLKSLLSSNPNDFLPGVHRRFR